jgi:hypothetical protein
LEIEIEIKIVDSNFQSKLRASSTTLFCFDGRTDEAFNSREKDRAVRGIWNISNSTREKDRAVRGISNTSNNTILKTIEIILTTEDHRGGM